MSEFDANLRVTDYASSEVNVRGLLGGLLTADWRQALIARGYGWHAHEGAFSTPAAGGGAAAIIDIDRPNLLVSIPAGYTMVPLRIFSQAQIPISAADSDESEIVFAVDVAAAVGGITSQTTVVTPVNMRTGTGSGAVTTGCPATIYQTLSANITAPTLGLELGHAVKVVDYVGTPANAMMTDLSLLYEPRNPPLLVGPCCLYCYHGGTVATTGFTQASFLIFASSLITGLS